MSRSIYAKDVKVGDTVLRYGMWFDVESIEILPAEAGGDLINMHLDPVSRGGRCTLALYPQESITVQ